jgi:transcriptional regulator with XRE-family HTH domain
MDILETTATSEVREVIRCLHCQLVQFRPQNNHCRRCLLSLVRPAPQPAAAESGNGCAREAGEEGAPNVAEAIRVLRRRHGLSQRELAERMNVPRTYVSKIENDKATPTIASLERLAAAMDTSIATILRCTGAGTREERIRELMSDGFIQQLVPYLVQLQPVQRTHILAELRDRSAVGISMSRAMAATASAAR